MGREISLFADYHSQENSLTNYCGLILKLLYEENPKSFEEILATLLTDEVNISVGPTFSQQTKKERSIPDLVIHQTSFAVYFETKLSDWFYSDQLERHVAGFKDKSGLNILFALSDFDIDDLTARFSKDIERAKKDGVIFKAITFEDFIGALEKAKASVQLSNILEEFVLYLDRNERLPKWRYLLDVVNCGGTMDEVQRGVYMCPDTGGPYSHRRALYFGPYSQKKVQTIFEIKAIVVVDRNLGEGRISWKNVKQSDRELIDEAKTQLSKSAQWRIEENQKHALQVFLLDNGQPTNFIKDTSGGMQQSKKYFWDIARDCKSSKELAAKLSGKRWGDFLDRDGT